MRWKEYRKRIGDRGIWGTIRFWLRKQVMNFNDGTFSWYQEGYFQAWEYPLNIDSSWKEPLRAFYWQDGSNYIWFTTISQGLWLFVLLGVITEAGMLLWTAVSTIRRPKYRTEENLSDRLCLSTCDDRYIYRYVFICYVYSSKSQISI